MKEEQKLPQRIIAYLVQNPWVLVWCIVIILCLRASILYVTQKVTNKQTYGAFTRDDIGEAVTHCTTLTPSHL